MKAGPREGRSGPSAGPLSRSPERGAGAGVGLSGRCARLLDRAFPGLGWRPTWLTALGLLALTVYYNHGGVRVAPEWFKELSLRVTGVEAPLFHGHGWSHLFAVAALMIVPLLACRAAEGWGPRDLGLGIAGSGREFVLVLVLWLALVPVIGLASTTPSFARVYPRLPEAATNGGLFLAYQAFYLVKWTAWEFFFRGYLLFGLRRDLGSRAVLVSTAAFVLMHANKPELEMLSSLPGGLVLCWIALRSGSIWPGVFIHSMVATTMDFFASSWWRTP